MGWLVLEEPDGSERWVEIPREGALVCGRSRHADLILPEDTISRRHATFLHRNGVDWLADAGGRNGTRVNGNDLIARHRLRVGDQVEIGSYRMVYHLQAHLHGDGTEDSTTDLGGDRGDDTEVAPAEERLEAQMLRDTPRWRDVEIIGRGGMGEVYRAFDRDLGAAVAIKRLRRRGGGDDRLLQRLHAREAAIGRTMQHPNVVVTLEDGVHDGDPYLLLEWIQGVTLEGILSQPNMPRALSRLDALELLRQIALGLAAAHQKGVVHSDLKPANLLVLQSEDEAEDTDNLAILESPEESVIESAPSDVDDELTREIQRRAMKDLNFTEPPFVGREAELELLSQAAAEAADGGCRWVLIFGDRGVGKRRLVQEFRTREMQEQRVVVQMDDDIVPPPESAEGVWITLLPSLLPDDPKLLREYEQRRMAGELFEIHLQAFLRGQAIRMVERVVNHTVSARLFVDSVWSETQGNAARLCQVLQRSFDEDAWVPSGGGYRFRADVFLPDTVAATRLLLERFREEELGLRDFLISIAPLGRFVDFDTLKAAVGMDSASQFYILEHAVKAGYLRRDPCGLYEFVNAAFRHTLERRLDAKARIKIMRRAIPGLTNLLDRDDTPAQVYHDVAQLYRELDHIERSFRCFLAGALRARASYDRATFLEGMDQARACYLKTESKSRTRRDISQQIELLLGQESRGVTGLERLRKLPCDVRVKIADFGIARRSADEDAPTQSQKAEPWGTPRFMSPEQAQRKPLTVASDIFCLGILACELLTGRHPLGRLRGREAIQAAAGNSFSTAALDQELPADLVQLLRAMMERDPRARPSSSEVAKRLQELQLRS